MWLFAARTTISNSIAFAVVTLDGLKEYVKDKYSEALFPVRAKMIGWANVVEKKTGISIFNKNEADGASMVKQVFDGRDKNSGYAKNKLVLISAAFATGLMFPLRFATNVIRASCMKIASLFQELLEALRACRTKISGKYIKMKERMGKIGKAANADKRDDGATGGAKPVDLEEEEGSKLDNPIDLEEKESGKSNESEGDEEETVNENNGDNQVSKDEGTTGGENENETSSSQLLSAENCGLTLELDSRASKSKNKKEESLEESSLRKIRRKGTMSSVTDCGLRAAFMDYIGNKIAAAGYKKALEAIKRTEESKEPALRTIPDEAASSTAEGSQTADIDVLSFYFFNRTLGASSVYAIGDRTDCESELGLTTLGDVFINHSVDKHESVKQGEGKLTIVKFNSINCFFLYEKMLMVEGPVVLKLSLNDSSCISSKSYSAKEFITSGYNDDQKIIIGRVSLLTNNEDGVESIVSASHMIPYGRVFREEDSYDGVDTLCSSWVFENEPAKVRNGDDIISEGMPDCGNSLGVIKSDFFIGDKNSDFLMFICRKGDYRGHSGGLILDKNNRPIAVCVKQLKIDNQLSIGDNKSIIIGCKLDTVDNNIVVFNSRRIVNCNECNKSPRDELIDTAVINISVSMGRLKIDESLMNEKRGAKPASGKTCVIQTGLLDKVCELNKDKRAGVFLENHSKGNVLIRLLEIIKINKEVRIFDEPSEWIIKTIFEELVGNRVCVFVTCSNMLTLSVCSLLTCIGVQFRRAKNFFSIESACKNNSINRKSEIIVISSEDLVVDLVKNKNVRQNYFRDRCVIHALLRTCKEDNELEKVIIKSLLVVGQLVCVKAWELKPIVNVNTNYKMLDCPMMRYSQNSGHYKLLLLKKPKDTAASEAGNTKNSGRIMILTLATTRSAQENLTARVVSEQELCRSDVTIVNFASLSSDVICEGISDSEILCLSSWSSGDLSTKLYYNVLMDVSSDDLEVMMIQQALNFKLSNLEGANRVLTLSPSADSLHGLVNSFNHKIIEVKISDTAKPKPVFLDFFVNIINNMFFCGKNVYKKIEEIDSGDLIELNSIIGTSFYSVDKRKLLTDDYIKRDGSRIKTFRDKFNDFVDSQHLAIEKSKIVFTFWLRGVIFKIKFRLNRAGKIIKKYFYRIKAKAIAMMTVNCGSEAEDKEAVFFDSKDDMSDASSTVNKNAVEEGTGSDGDAISVVSSSESGETEKKEGEKEEEIKSNAAVDRSHILRKFEAKRKEMKEASKKMMYNMIEWIKDKFNSFKVKLTSGLNWMKTKSMHLLNKLGLMKKSECLTESCAYYSSEENEIGVLKKILKSLAVSAAVVKMASKPKDKDIGSKMLAVFIADNVIYEIVNSVNKTVGSIYWKVTSIPAAIISSIEVGCQLIGKRIVISYLEHKLTFGGEPLNSLFKNIKENAMEALDVMKKNSSITFNCAVPTGLVVKEGSRFRDKVGLSQALELGLKVFELCKRAMFRIRLAEVVKKLWKLISGRSFDTKMATGVLKAVPCYIETDKVCYYGGIALLLSGIVKMAAMKTEEKLAMLGVIAEKKHLADNINLYLNDRSEYANMIRVVCVSAYFLLRKDASKFRRYLAAGSAMAAIVDWFFSDETYGGLTLSVAHVFSRVIAANSVGTALVAGLSAWWEDGSSNKISMNTLILLGKRKNIESNSRMGYEAMRRRFDVDSLMLEQGKEREGNKKLLDKEVDAAEAFNDCMVEVRKKKVSSRFMSKLIDEAHISSRDRDLYINIDATLMKRDYSEKTDTILTIKDLYMNQCRYLGRLREIPLPREEAIESTSKQSSVLMVAKAMWEGVIDEKSLYDWEAAGDSRSHVLIAIAERNDSEIFFNVNREDMVLFCDELAKISNKIAEKLSGLTVNINIHRINWMNIISISNDRATPGILTRCRTYCKLTASYLPFYKNRVEAMREILANNDVNEENEIINVFAKRRIEKKKISELTGREAVITRTIQANECDYKTAICDIFNITDKMVKVTRSSTGVSVGMNFFIEFANDDELCRSIARSKAASSKMITKRISLDHSSYDGSQRNWSIEAAKIFRQQLVKSLICAESTTNINKFLDSCYESLKCRLMLTAQGDLFGLTGQQMSGHATTSVDNSIKAKGYCVALIKKIEEATGWQIIEETIRVQGDDTKMEVVCDKKHEKSEVLVKEVISKEMAKMGQKVKGSKIEIFKGSEASNFLSHYAKDCICAIRNDTGKRLTVLKLPGRGYRDNINSLATTLKASTTKKYRKELGLLAAKAASFLTMYIGDPYLSSACCIVLAYCLSEIKYMRRKTNKIVVAKDKLAYLLSSSEDIETVSVDVESILHLHGIGRILNSYCFESWVVGLDEEEKDKAMSVVFLIRNVMSLLNKRGNNDIKEAIKGIKKTMEEVLNDRVAELNIDELNHLAKTGMEPIELEIINKEVAYEPYLRMKEEIRKEAGLTKEIRKIRHIIIKNPDKMNLCKTIASITNGIEKDKSKYDYVDQFKYLNEGGFEVTADKKRIKIVSNGKEIVCFHSNVVDALLFGASISNSINIIATNQEELDAATKKKTVVMKKRRMYDLNELSSLQFVQIMNNKDQDRNNLILKTAESLKIREAIIDAYHNELCSEFVNFFLKI